MADNLAKVDISKIEGYVQSIDEFIDIYLSLVCIVWPEKKINPYVITIMKELIKTSIDDGYEAINNRSKWIEFSKKCVIDGKAPSQQVVTNARGKLVDAGYITSKLRHGVWVNKDILFAIKNRSFEFKLTLV